jgi:transcriptional regulator with XRE-family HTH domain
MLATLEQMRFSAGLSLSQIARRANVATSTVSRAEKGEPVQKLKAVQIARALSQLLGQNVTIDDIEGLNVYE